ncbi:hypothetical protein Glove_21g46 [Diversispora epigaea]|uniref:Uncharacterized protein n=1 Tax=Diversispora epigaea TaxID=1348612 RepID=A0A397JNF0_9GLOM|nr:hypothetical protein Glove_21g46 [Diversispora epigaea]
MSDNITLFRLVEGDSKKEPLKLLPKKMIMLAISRKKSRRSYLQLVFLSASLPHIYHERTYITNIIVFLLQASLEDFSNGDIFLNIAEHQNMASKTCKSFESNEERFTYKISIRKKSNIMVTAKYRDKIFELAYVESSQIFYTRSKKKDNSVKL